MAHASRLEKAKILLKKAKKARNKRKLAMNQLPEEEREDKIKKRTAYNLKERIRLMEWDYNRRQLHVGKFPIFASLLKEQIALGVSNDEKLRYEKILKRIQ